MTFQDHQNHVETLLIFLVCNSEEFILEVPGKVCFYNDSFLGKGLGENDSFLKSKIKLIIDLF